ncbi:hypothetical protein SAY86_000522 [Trapa natans]|uniref:Uncharacterized protein n=1 Tax=Trapa natans TaxID=22666 RepID=A0AAN7MC30_TRANT|nr:hypothetical protein SAY86_000522 [Trapa natans]
MGGRSDADYKWTMENSDCHVRTPTGGRGGVDFGGEIDGDEVMGEGRNGDPEVASFGLGEERNMYNFNKLIRLALRRLGLALRFTSASIWRQRKKGWMLDKGRGEGGPENYPLMVPTAAVEAVKPSTIYWGQVPEWAPCENNEE